MSVLLGHSNDLCACDRVYECCFLVPVRRAGGTVQRVQEGQLLPDPMAPSTSLPAFISGEEESRQKFAEGGACFEKLLSARGNCTA